MAGSLTAFGWVLRVVGAWTLLILVLVSGLAWVTSTVDSASAGLSQSGLVAALHTPGLVVRIMPLICALGTGLAAARMMARGERQALESAGLAPARSALGALSVGLIFGILGWVSHAELVHRAETRARQLHSATGPSWVWTDAGPLRRSDGLQVQISGGRIIDIAIRPDSEERIALEAQLQQPGLASAAALAGSDRLAVRLERHQRLARIGSCAGLAWLCWLPWSRKPQRQLLAALLLGLGWQLLALGLQGSAMQGKLSLQLATHGPVAVLGGVMLVGLMLVHRRPSGLRRSGRADQGGGGGGLTSH